MLRSFNQLNLFRKKSNLHSIGLESNSHFKDKHKGLKYKSFLLILINSWTSQKYSEFCYASGCINETQLCLHALNR